MYFGISRYLFFSLYTDWALSGSAKEDKDESFGVSKRRRRLYLLRNLTRTGSNHGTTSEPAGSIEWLTTFSSLLQRPSLGANADEYLQARLFGRGKSCLKANQ